jgi:hypothetical protein
VPTPPPNSDQLCVRSQNRSEPEGAIVSLIRASTLEDSQSANGTIWAEYVGLLYILAEHDRQPFVVFPEKLPQIAFGTPIA